jgi:hypothetical protein
MPAQNGTISGRKTKMNGGMGMMAAGCSKDDNLLYISSDESCDGLLFAFN